MSSTQVTESSKTIFLSIRVIEVKLYSNLSKILNVKVCLRLGKRSWLSGFAKNSSKSLKFEQSCTFEIDDFSTLSIELMHTTLFTNPTELGGVSLKLPNENQKKTQWQELTKHGIPIGKIFISYLIDEKNEINHFIKEIHYLELEREQIKFLKMKYLKKLTEIKGERDGFRKKSDSFLTRIKGIIENEGELEKIKRERKEIKHQLKEAISVQGEVRAKLVEIGVGNAKTRSAHVLPRKVPQVVRNPVFKC